MTEYRRVIIEKKYKQIQVPPESIYNLANSSPSIEEKSQRYQSKYNHSTKMYYDSNKRSHETMGYAKVPLRRPAEYLKKHERENYTYPESKRLECLNKDNKKPPLPKSHDAPPILHEKRNFIELNRVNAQRRPPYKPPKKMVDNQKGNSFYLEFSGLVPKFVWKKEFGKTPRYLVKLKRCTGFLDDSPQPSFSGREPIKLSDEERSDLLEGLRTNWEDLYKHYMTLPLMIDTESLKVKKLELERKLDLLEKDISFLEKNEDNDIYILPG